MVTFDVIEFPVLNFLFLRAPINKVKPNRMTCNQTDSYMCSVTIVVILFIAALMNIP